MAPSARLDTAMVPLVDDMTIRRTPAATAALHSTRVPLT